MTKGLHSDSFDFKNVKHLYKQNFGSDGKLLPKKQVLQNIINNENLSDIDKRKELNFHKTQPDYVHGYTTVICYASWCSHCLHLKPIFDNICDTTQCTNAQLAAIDCNNDTEELIPKLSKVLKTQLHGKSLISGYPTVIQFKDGRYFRTFENANRSPENILAFVIGNGDYSEGVKL